MSLIPIPNISQTPATDALYSKFIARNYKTEGAMLPPKGKFINACVMLSITQTAITRYRRHTALPDGAHDILPRDLDNWLLTFLECYDHSNMQSPHMYWSTRKTGKNRDFPSIYPSVLPSQLAAMLSEYSKYITTVKSSISLVVERGFEEQRLYETSISNGVVEHTTNVVNVRVQDDIHIKAMQTLFPHGVSARSDTLSILDPPCQAAWAHWKSSSLVDDSVISQAVGDGLFNFAVAGDREGFWKLYRRYTNGVCDGW